MVALRVTELPEPELEFGSPANLWCDPKVGLVREGPFSARVAGGQPERVRLGIVGPAAMIDTATRWFERSQSLLLSKKENRRRFPDYPGFKEIFRTPLELANRWTYEIPALGLAQALACPDHERLGQVVDLYAEGVSTLAQREMGPNVVICSLPEELLAQCAIVERNGSEHVRSGIGRGHPDGQLALPFEFAADDEEEEHLVYRTFRRALKARVMVARSRLPIQIAHAHLFEDGPNKDDPATRAWSVSLGLYYKAGGLPWRLANQQPHACFVGVSFHRLNTNKRQLVYASMAQAFSSEIEGFVLRGERIPPGEDAHPHLTPVQAERLGQQVLEQYRERTGRPPLRVTLHKTTAFEEAERDGFYAAFSEIPVVELVTLQPTDFRLLPFQDYPARRGTVCFLNGAAQYLYTTGFVEDWGTYPGPHIPSPYRVVIAGDRDDTDARRVCEETLGLTKMNWNSAMIGGRNPITLEMASKVGPIMAEVPEEQEPEMSFRYYM